MAEAKPVAGVAVLGDNVYVLRPKSVDEVEVYDAITFELRHCLTVPNSRGFTDMTSCNHFLCLYIGDHIVRCIHRLNVQGSATNATQWPVNDEPARLSVTAAHNVLVTCNVVRKVKEFSSRGNLVREMTLPDDVTNPWHAIQLLSGELVVCHGEDGDAVHRVVVMSSDGKSVLRSHGGQKGSRTDQYNVPCHLSVDDSEFVFVLDYNNRRVTLLSPTLQYTRQVASRDQFKWMPDRLSLDVVRRRLYVADNELKDGKGTAGRVLVFNV